MRKLFLSVFLLGSILLSVQAQMEIPFWREGAHMFVYVKMEDGKNHTFLFDTGASYNMVSKDLANGLGLTFGKSVPIKSFGGMQTGYYTSVDKMELGGEALEKEHFVILDSFGAGHMAYSGVIGTNFFRNKVLTIDNVKEVITIGDGSIPFDSSALNLPLDFYGGVPGVEVSIHAGEGKQVSGKMFMDTGADAAMLFLPHAEQKYQLSRCFEKSISSRVKSPGGDFITTTGRLQSIRLGGLAIHHVPVRVMSFSKELPQASSYYLGMIGNKLLEKFNITFNGPAKTVTLEPISNYALEEPIVIDPSGFSFMTNVKMEFVVSNVQENGAAFKAGMQAGDVIVSIDDIPSADYSVPEFLSLISSVGSPLSFSIRRGEELLSLNFVPEDIL
ncbi:aspartyl protease family protein [Carboxylicivirga marina]|uniref:Aspartyl protease family protein n=1 Tax=Carboxylicivirga marina TaxID=2800988 RepID=A0ABS1HDU1_9BACT|nr:aspartyl protease family protein [Carboxylicivirga marina]MBK3515841.1 aspartyl protease family protein [Carboxylicivirga marina]